MKTPIIITGIGSRETPQNILSEMTKIGEFCKQNNIYIRSGHADGADVAFEVGAQENCIVYLPWWGFNNKITSNAKKHVIKSDENVIKMTWKYHPYPSKLSPAAHKLMNRNVYQVLGEDLNSPSNAVICWTKDGKDSGGTGQAIRIAWDYKIPVYNMYFEEFNTYDKILEVLQLSKETT